LLRGNANKSKNCSQAKKGLNLAAKKASFDVNQSSIRKKNRHVIKKLDRSDKKNLDAPNVENLNTRAQEENISVKKSSVDVSDERMTREVISFILDDSINQPSSCFNKN
jgi:hypothetical protein